MVETETIERWKKIKIANKSEFEGISQTNRKLLTSTTQYNVEKSDWRLKLNQYDTS